MYLVLHLKEELLQILPRGGGGFNSVETELLFRFFISYLLPNIMRVKAKFVNNRQESMISSEGDMISKI